MVVVVVVVVVLVLVMLQMGLPVGEELRMSKVLSHEERCRRSPEARGHHRHGESVTAAAPRHYYPTHPHIRLYMSGLNHLCGC